jgi:hypothetical protein
MEIRLSTAAMRARQHWKAWSLFKRATHHFWRADKHLDQFQCFDCSVATTKETTQEICFLLLGAL